MRRVSMVVERWRKSCCITMIVLYSCTVKDGSVESTLDWPLTTWEVGIVGGWMIAKGFLWFGGLLCWLHLLEASSWHFGCASKDPFIWRELLGDVCTVWRRKSTAEVNLCAKHCWVVWMGCKIDKVGHLACVWACCVVFQMWYRLTNCPRAALVVWALG